MSDYEKGFQRAKKEADEIIGRQAEQITHWFNLYQGKKKIIKEQAEKIEQVRENGNRAIENLWKTINEQAEQITAKDEQLVNMKTTTECLSIQNDLYKQRLKEKNALIDKQ